MSECVVMWHGMAISACGESCPTLFLIASSFKFKFALLLINLQAYARVRFRTEPLSTFDIGEGLTCEGKIPLPGLLPILRSIPLRVEYRLRINTPQPEFTISRGKKDGRVRIHLHEANKIDLFDAFD
jgi:hypothetical protein